MQQHKSVTKTNKTNTKITRRQLLKKSIATGILVTVVNNFVTTIDGAWAFEVNHIKPSSMATLIQVARDIYPHDKISDEYYAKAVKAYDNATQAKTIEKFIDKLNKTAGGKYINIGWEKNRVKILQKMQNEPFFQNMRARLVVGLYNQKDVWPIFGYEGESFTKGGYIGRGFDDIKWT